MMRTVKLRSTPLAAGIALFALLLRPSLVRAEPTAPPPGGMARYRVSLEVYPGEDPAVIAQQLAATYRGRLESTDPADGGLVLALSESGARLLKASPRVSSIEAIGVQTNDTSWSTGMYAYDGSGNIREIGSDVFRYDKLGRVRTGTAGAGHSQAYTYDAAGNILTVTTDGAPSPDLTLCVDPATNQIDKITVPSCNAFGAYDAGGNMTSYLGTQTFAYDGLNMVRESNIDNVRRLYLYTPNDERIATMTMVGSNETSSDWALRDSAGRVLRRFQRSGGSWSWKEDYVYRGTALLAAEVSGPERTLHFHADHLGTPRLITGSGGAEISRHAYYPFGREASTSGQDPEVAKFTGHERDAANLDYMHARYYMPYGGRFLSVDPVLDMAKVTLRPQMWNRYAYVTNNPINATDPDGRAENRVSNQLEHDQLAVIHGEMTMDQYIENNAARFNGAMTGLTIVEGFGALRSLYGLARAGLGMLARGSTEALFTNAAKREVLAALREGAGAMSSEQRATAIRQVQRATTKESVSVIQNSNGAVQVLRTRPGRDGAQTFVTTVMQDGTEQTVQTAVNAAGRTTHYDPKNAQSLLDRVKNWRYR